MEWSGSDTARPRLYVGRMVLGLMLAALLGAVGGLLWHSSGLGESAGADEQEQAGEAEEG